MAQAKADHKAKLAKQKQDQREANAAKIKADKQAARGESPEETPITEHGHMDNQVSASIEKSLDDKAAEVCGDDTHREKLCI